MTTKKTFKKLVSFLLAVIMMFSVMTTAFAAETDVAQTSANVAGGTKLYLNPGDWDKDDARFACYFFGNGEAWVSATKVSGEDYYVVTAPAGSWPKLIWARMNGATTENNWNNKWNQTKDIETYDGTKNLFTVSDHWNKNKATGSWSSYTPPTPSEPDETEEPTVPVETEEPTDPVDKITISFLLNADTKWVHNDDAKMFIKSGSEIIEMDETIDTKSGHVMWTADVDEYSSYTFYRTSYFFDESNAASKPWNTWTASGRNTNTVYIATSKVGGSWVAQSTVNAADPTDITNFWDDLWIDTKGEGKPEDAVKVYYTGSTFHLYVPSYVDLSDVTVYSDHDKVVIGGKEYASGTKANLTTGKHTFAFKDGTTTTNKGNITIYQTESTAAMLMTTNEELFTGLTANNDENNKQGLWKSDAWPSGSGINAENYNNFYKDAIETKGSYYFYKEDGTWLNDDTNEPKMTTLKKIKGRGNSSFASSMRVYGKYAYNFNLDKATELIDGASASKKWCLLANNPDITMMRNTFIYSLADDVGLKYGPETRLVDLYDNGKYLGAYILTEKVEYGGSTLMSDMENLDDGNEDANIKAYDNKKIMDVLEDHLVQSESSVTVNGQKYTYQYTTSDDPTNFPYYHPTKALIDKDFTEYNFLLEWELYNRYKNEASWFVSPRTGQAVVVKYPEFATKEEMEWIISEYEEAESAIYSDNTDAIKAAVDVDSFARMYLIQELALNLDSCATSYYVHNDLATGKLVASPVWDYDWSLGAYSNTTASGKKYVYNGSSVSVNSTTMDNPKQMFVKDKALKTDAGDTTKKPNYNFQAKLVHNAYVWERCQYYWTNLFVPNLERYVDNDYTDAVSQKDDGVVEGRILKEWLPRFESSMIMNDARWGSVTFTGDNWGTKITTNYNPRSFDFKVGQGNAGNQTKKYSNSVYYLNDWTVERWNYMSGTGGLYNEKLKATYEITDVTFEGVQDSTDDTKLTVTPSATVTMNGAAVDAADIVWKVYVNDSLAYSSTFAEESHTITLSPGSNKVYVVVGVKDTDEAVESSVKTFNTYVPNYTIDNVTFMAEQSADESQLTVTPSAVAKLDDVELTASEYQYTIYLNGKVVAGPVTFETVSTTINLEKSKVNEVYIVVTPVGVTTVSAKSATEKFAYAVEVEKVHATLYFKSSTSLRYRPSLTVGTGDKTAMIKDDNGLLGKNASQTQSYYWYYLDVEIEKDKATKLTFTNSYSMNGVATVTLSESADALYFGVDNLNDGAVAVQLPADAENEHIRNFYKSATHMVTNDATAAGVAKTRIAGVSYNMGDADGDGNVSVLDSTQMQRALVGKTELSETGTMLADFDLNSVNSIMDATLVQVYLTN